MQTGRSRRSFPAGVCMKEWYTAQEIADMTLPKLPFTKRNCNKKASRENWNYRERAGNGGGREYHISSLPLESQAALVERFVVKKDDVQRAVIEAPEQGNQRRFDARLIILRHYEIHVAEMALSQGKAQTTFCLMYKGRMIDGMPGWVYESVPDLTDRTLRRWRKARREEQYAVLKKSQNNRTGTSFLERAQGGKVAQYIGGLILAKPFLNAGHLRDLCLAEFGNTVKIGDAEIPMPDLRLFQMHVKSWKERNADMLMKLTDPDGFKNRMMMAVGKADAGIERLNQRWEIDASPADVLCTDGRHCIYAVIDVWSRRALFSVSPTASAEGALLLVRKAIMAWGVPEEIKTDNGSDFVSRRFQQALLHLGIDQPVATPFSPEQKAFVERVIGTMQHQLMPILPGFIGHNVGDRKKIEARRAFAQRLGADDKNALAVEMSAVDLQTALDRWASDKYACAPHAGLNGSSPRTKALGWTQPVRRIENERALDLLLSPIAGQDGLRTVGKKGLAIDSAFFYGEGLEIMVGRQVFVRHDPSDMGRVFVFSTGDGTFICEAICMEREGADWSEAAAIAKANQKEFHKEQTKEMQRQKRAITAGRVAEQYLSHAAKNAAQIVSLPMPSVPHTSPALEAAASVYDASSTNSPSDRAERDGTASLLHFEPKKRPTTEQDDRNRWLKRAKALYARQAVGDVLTVADATWLARTESQSWFKAELEFEALQQKAAAAIPPTHPT